MLTFPTTCFLVETKYPDSSVRVQFGKSWTFTAPPDAPDQRGFSLTLKGMKYYVNLDGSINATTGSDINNLAALETFYQTVRLFDDFHFPHPIYGTLVCRFNKPLQIPKGIPGGLGVVEDMTIELIEVPQ